MLRQLETIDEIVEVLGGRKALIALTGRNVRSASQFVWNWRHCGTFPADTYDAIIDALALRGCTAPRGLWRWSRPAGEGSTVYPDSHTRRIQR